MSIAIAEERVRDVCQRFTTSREAADELGITRSSFTRLLLRYGIKIGSDFHFEQVESPTAHIGNIDTVLDKHEITEDEIKLFITNITTHEDASLIIPFGDLHYLNKNYDKKMANIVLKWLYANDNTRIIGMGDYLESSVIDSPGLFDQAAFLDAQFDEIVELFQPLADDGRIVGLLDGNHEHRVKKHTGLDITDKICKMLKVPYLGVGSLHQFNIISEDTGEHQSYTLYATHGDTCAKYPQTKLLACMKLQTIANAEIYCMGHTHSLAEQKIERYEIENGQVVKRSTHFVLTGAYLRYWQTYAHMKGMPPSGDSGSPKIQLHAKEHRISVSL